MNVAIMADSRPGSRPAHGSSWHRNLLLTLPFLLLYWANEAHHAQWFDEVNAWGLAAASGSLGQLFDYVHFEGHPWLWYFVLWLPSRLTHDPLAMKGVIVAVGTAIYLMLGLASPFTRLQKVLIFLNYYIVMEYTVMNRMYGIMVLCALVYAWRRTVDPDAVLVNVVPLAVMANTDMTGVLLSGALLLEYGYERWTVYRGAGWNAGQRRRAVGAVALYAVMVGLSVGTLLPSKEISWQSSGKIGAEAGSVQHLVRSVTNMTGSPWWPISPQFPSKFWETDAKQQKKLLLLAPVVLWAYWRSFRKERNLLLLMALTLGFGTLFADVVYAGRVRHWGIAFVSFLVALWFQQARRVRDGDEAGDWSAWTYGLIGLGVVGGLAAVGSSWTHPFSTSKPAAAWIERNQPAGSLLVGEPDVSFASVAIQLQRPVYFMECGCVDTFKLFSRHREDYDEVEMADRLAATMAKTGKRELLFVFYRPLREDDYVRLRSRSLRVKPLTQFPGAEMFLESYYLYAVEGGAGV